MPHHLSDPAQLRAFRMATNESVVSDISNLTAKENQVEKDRLRLIEQQNKFKQSLNMKKKDMMLKQKQPTQTQTPSIQDQQAII